MLFLVAQWTTPSAKLVVHADYTETFMSTLQKKLDDLAIYELTPDDWRRMKSVIDVFTQLMPEYSHYVTRLQESTEKTGPDHADHLHHVWLIEIAGHPVGMTAFEYVRRFDVGMCMDIAIFPSYRQYCLPDGRNIAHAVIDIMVEMLQLDAQKYGKLSVIPLGGEVKYPRLLERFQSYGFIKLLIDYWEPPDISGTSDILGFNGTPEEIEELKALGYQQMNLGMMIPKNGEINIDDPSLWARVVRGFHLTHYNLTEESRAVQIAMQSIDQMAHKLPEASHTTPIAIQSIQLHPLNS
jgi:hypothetical protein